jgi:hypothetical protein
VQEPPSLGGLAPSLLPQDQRLAMKVKTKEKKPKVISKLFALRSAGQTAVEEEMKKILKK